MHFESSGLSLYLLHAVQLQPIPRLTKWEIRTLSSCTPEIELSTPSLPPAQEFFIHYPSYDRANLFCWPLSGFLHIVFGTLSCHYSPQASSLFHEASSSLFCLTSSRFCIKIVPPQGLNVILPPVLSVNELRRCSFMPVTWISCLDSAAINFIPPNCKL